MFIAYILTLTAGIALGYFAADYFYTKEEYIPLTPQGRQSLLDAINDAVNVNRIANQKSESEN
tara:strand:- start:609 stop:797 length:189 start_codon:yes stop_codon:yes gene_type:complete